ncbi:MAG: hypothetical protein OXC60_09795 [Litoreibacter sp.]|nr:hypothetical protein [Litoreibacter sp.]
MKTKAERRHSAQIWAYRPILHRAGVDPKTGSQGGREPTPPAAPREPPGTARGPLESTSASEDDDPDWINAILSQTDD